MGFAAPRRHRPSLSHPCAARQQPRASLAGAPRTQGAGLASHRRCTRQAASALSAPGPACPTRFPSARPEDGACRRGPHASDGPWRSVLANCAAERGGVRRSQCRNLPSSGRSLLRPHGVGAQLAAVTAADGGLRAHLRQLGTAEAAAAALPFAAVEIVHAPACSAARRPTLARRMTAAAVWIACQAHGCVTSHPETPHRPVPPRPRPAFPLRRTARRRRRDDAAHDTPLRRPVRWPPPGRTRSLS